MVGAAPRDPFTEQVIGLAIAVHRELGPGLLESAYEECLCYELKDHGIDLARQVPLALSYKGVRLDCGYRIDVVVAGKLLLEIKAVDRLLPIHDAPDPDLFAAEPHKSGFANEFQHCRIEGRYS